METSDTSYSQEPGQGRSPAWIAGGAIALIVLGLLAYALLAGPARPPAVGEPVPDFRLTALDGSPMTLSAQQGKVVVLNVFASWCDPCRREAFDLEMTWQAYRERGVQFFGIAYKDANSKAQAFLDEFGVTYPCTVETGNRTARAYGVTAVPETFVIDQQGQLVRHYLGAITQTELSQELDALLGR
jgi:cytochrome c biogenesis protein CcmG/thiol:disulfide interchange protein DsbE